MNNNPHSSPSCRVVVLIGGSGSNLQAIIDATQPYHSFQVVQVISHNPDAFGLTRAQNAGIATTTIDHRAFMSRASFEEALQRAIDSAQPDLIILAGFMRILSEGFVQDYTGKLLNIHPSLLPNYKGLHTHQRVLDAHETWHGTSVHFVTPELDGGPIIAQVKFAIEPNDSAETLRSKVQQAEHWIYPKVINWFAENRLKHQLNDVLLDGELLAPMGKQFSLNEIEGLIP